MTPSPAYAMLTRLFAPVPYIEIWRWNELHTDFSVCPGYDTPPGLRGPYSADFTPAWKTVVETAQDDNIRETVVVAASRIGKSENVLLNIIRYTIGHKPCPLLYITGDQQAAESFMERRIKLGLKCNRITAGKLADSATITGEHRIFFPDMEIRVTWPRNKMAFKQDGWAMVLCDEVSIWADFKVDQMRKRIDTYPFGHIVIVGSLDPEKQIPLEQDALWMAFKATDQRYLFMPDPKTGKPFRFEMGRVSTPFGLKWDEKECKKKNGDWDMNKVKKSAHYVTPDGTRIEEKERMPLIEKGEWVPTVQDAPSDVAGFHKNAFYASFRTFGDIAVAFLKAKDKGYAALRTFNYEYLGTDELHYDLERISPGDVKEVVGRGSYIKGAIPTKNPVYLVCIADAHKAWVAWQVWALGKSWVWLVSHGSCSTLEDLDGIARGPYRDLAGKDYSCHGIFCDSGYRTMEVYRFALGRANVMPLKGDTGATTTMAALVTYSDLEKFPDSTPMPRKLKLAHIHPTAFRDELTAAIRFPKGTTEDDAPFRLRFHEECETDPTFLEQMSNKHPFESEPNKQGKTYRYYKPVPDGAPDHHFDMGSYALAVRQMAWRDIAGLEGEGEGVVKAPKKEPVAPPPPPPPEPEGPLCVECGKLRMTAKNGQWRCKCGNCVSQTPSQRREWGDMEDDEL